MKIIILASSCAVLIGSVVMILLLLKEKKRRATYAYVALFALTIILALRMLLKVLGA